MFSTINDKLFLFTIANAPFRVWSAFFQAAKPKQQEDGSKKGVKRAIKDKAAQKSSQGKGKQADLLLLDLIRTKTFGLHNIYARFVDSNSISYAKP